MTGFETGFHAHPRQTSLARMIAQLRQQADAHQTEAVTGRPADTAKALGGRVAEAAELRGRIDDLAHHGENLALAEARTDVIARTLRELGQIADDLANDGTTALASGLGEGRATVAASAMQALDRAVSALNVTLGGRSLFAGDATDRPAVADAGQLLAASEAALSSGTDAAGAHGALRADFTDPAGSFATTLYTGGQGDAPRTTIAEGETVSYGLRADEPAIRDLLLNVAALAKAFDGSLGLDAEESAALARRAIAGLRTASEDVAAASGRIGAAQERIAVVKTRRTAEEAALTLAYNELTGGDPYRAALDLTAVEGQLETLYATTARLSRLSLSSYLGS